MGKPTKIHKKKSFMFTTKHHSFMGVMGLIIAIINVGTIITLAIQSYNQQGDVEIGFGGVGLFMVLLGINGIIAGVSGVKERDAYVTSGIIAIVTNVILLIFWTVIIVLSL